MGFGIFVFLGTVSRNMLISWPMGFGVFGFSGAVSRNTLLSDFGEASESLFLLFWGLWVLEFLLFWGLSRGIG